MKSLPCAIGGLENLRLIQCAKILFQDDEKIAHIAQLKVIPIRLSNILQKELVNGKTEMKNFSIFFFRNRDIVKN